MADGGAIKQVTGEMVQAAGEVLGEVKDAAREMAEQGVQSATGTQLTPQQIQQKQQQDQNDLAEARRKIALYDNQDQEQKQVRQANNQKEADRVKAEQQEEAVQVQQAQSQATQDPNKVPDAVSNTYTEVKQGKGVGG